MHTLFCRCCSRFTTAKVCVGHPVGCPLRWSLGVTSSLFAASLGSPHHPKWGRFTIWGCGTRRRRRGCGCTCRTLERKAAAPHQYQVTGRRSALTHTAKLSTMNSWSNIVILQDCATEHEWHTWHTPTWSQWLGDSGPPSVLDYPPQKKGPMFHIFFEPSIFGMPQPVAFTTTCLWSNQPQWLRDPGHPSVLDYPPLEKRPHISDLLNQAHLECANL